jgi:hypothetical protein
MEKRKEHGEAGEECQCASSLRKERESGGGAAYCRRLLDNFGHGAHHHGPNLESPAQKTAGEPDLI